MPGSVAAEPYPWPADGAMALGKTALACIDWQYEYCSAGGYLDAMGCDTTRARAGLGPTVLVLEAARSLGMSVVHTHEGHGPDLSDCPPNKQWRSARAGAAIGGTGPRGRFLVRGEPGWEIVPELAPQAGEWVIDKPAKGAFYATELDLVLSSHGVTHLVLTGANADVAVATTMREASDLGYECLLLSDCTGATEDDNYLATLEIIKMQGGTFGAVARSEDFIRALAT